MIEAVTLTILFGALLHRTFHIGLMVVGIMSALTSAFFFIYFLNKKAMVFGMVLGLSLFIGAYRVSLDHEKVPKELLQAHSIEGVVQSVDRRLDKTIVVVREVKYKKTIQVTLSSRTTALPRDTVIAKGSVEIPEDFVTDTGRTFEYKDYLQSKGISAIMGNASMSTVSVGRVSMGRLATMLRFYIADTFSRYVSFPVDGIVSGMLVGYQGGIPDSLQDLFRTTGVLHVLVLSGENITLLAIFLSTILKAVPFKARTGISAFAIVLVVLVSGSGVAAVRAGIMGCIALAAGLLKRGYVPLRALTVATLFFFFSSPSSIFVDPGFHLSMLATIFMILVLPKAQKLFSFIPEAIKEIMILAFCIPVFMLPYTMYFSGIEPISSPFANIVMTVAVPTIMLLGATIFAVSWISPLAFVLGKLLSFIGTVTLALLGALNHLPQLNTPPLSWRGVLGIYALFFIVLLRRELRLHSSSFVRGSP